MTWRTQYSIPLLALSIFYGCAAGILTPSHHDTEEYNKAFAAASQGNPSRRSLPPSHSKRGRCGAGCAKTPRGSCPKADAAIAVRGGKRAQGVCPA
jgi:hypothetical protein